MEIWQQQDSPCGNKEQVRHWVLQEISRDISRAEGNLGIGGDVKKTFSHRYQGILTVNIHRTVGMHFLIFTRNLQGQYQMI